MTSPRNIKHTIFIETPVAFSLGGRRGTGPMPLRFCAGYFPIFGQKEARKQTFAFWPNVFCLQVKPVWRKGILRPWPVPFLPNLLRPKIHVHFTISRLACIGEVLSPISATNNFDFLQNPVRFQHCYAIIDKNPWRMKP